MTTTNATPTRVVILGGGFAGVYTARHLLRRLGRRRDVEVELLSEENYFVFQPLLPEVAAGGIAAPHVVNPIRELVPGARFRCCKVVSVDFEQRRVLVSQGAGLELVPVPYDHLVFCLGKVSSFAAMPGVAEHGLAMKDLSDAFRLRNHVVRCLELADIVAEPAAKAALLHFVVAGGGFSGVETIGELSELVSRSLGYFPRIDPSEVRFSLVHSGARILPEMRASLGDAARRILERRGVKMLLGARVRAATPSAVYLADGSVLESRTFVCTVGTAPNPIVGAALASGGFARAELDGRPIAAFATERTLQCVGRRGYWAVGDCAGIPSPTGQGLCPPTGQFALREAALCADNVLRAIDGRPLRDFAFRALGSLASLGRRSAVAELLGVRLTGFLAWFLWRTLYLAKLPGLVRRLRVALDWTLDLLFPRDITQLAVLRHEHLHVHHYEAGEAIVRQGQIGRELFVILSGEVEVSADGAGAVARLGARDVFGERALLEDTPRNATVRATRACDVLVLNRSEFHAMVRSLPVLSDYFLDLLRSRHPDALARAEPQLALGRE
ncbi:MAG TPA: FAD-dependent oxidoreductase [Polyangiaceae bacterium]|nr:FAD-dependent oxidoreductase [Polyangiaceae bacterium]